MRKLATAAAVSLALASGSAQALILGEIEMRSALNQPIDAEIGLTSVAAGELEGMRVTLASQEAFSRAGIERSRVLTDLRFNVTENATGQPVIQISSRKPILEPFLNFLVDVEWRGGRLVREYTVLLDPPVFMSPSASVRNTATDTPATVTLNNEESILTPLPIDRGSIDVSSDEFDTASVTTIGDAVEVGDEQVSNVDVDVGIDVDFGSEGLGEVVELGTLDEVGDLPIAEFDESSVVEIPGAEFENTTVALTDPSVANANVLDFGEEVAFDSDSGWEVQVIGDAIEVGDNVGESLADAETVTLLSDEVESFEVEEFASSDIEVASTTSSGVAGEEVFVNENDTLWEIAEQNSFAGVSTQQMMIALLEANQQAFINGNINLVKAGAVLRIPDASQVSAISQSQALAEVSSQEQLWREYRNNLRGVQSNRTAIADAGSNTEASQETETLASNSQTSSAAQEILDQAREELRAQLEADSAANNELNIVADTDSTTTVASATADESSNPDTTKLGSINKKLQLAREELAAARLESEELVSQSTELDSVTTNMDDLVTMQQDKLAKLQAQLKQAQEQERLALEQASADTDGATAQELIAEAGNAVQDGVSGAVDGVTGAVDGVADAASGVGENASAAISDIAAADPTTELVELTPIDDTAAASIDAVEPLATTVADTTLEPIQAATASGPWYEKVMNKQGLAIGGLGLLAAGGLFAVLRRRRNVDDEELLDQVEFIDEEGDVVGNPDDVFNDDLAADMTGETVMLDSAMDDPDLPATAVESGVNLDAEMDAITAGAGANAEAAAPNDDAIDDTLSNDDTISEAEVYLAYGLHGQAEDLLTKAIDQDPSNAEYREKLLHTYHAQGNQAAFEECAAKYYQEFGGSSSPSWASICALGQELNPASELFVSDEGDVESVGKGGFDAPKLGVDDFLNDDSTGATEVRSQVREFSSAEEASSEGELGMDEADLLDQSLDPGFAFDQNDLEATGDFSQITDELNSEKAANESTAKATVEKAEDGIIEFDAPDVTDLDATQAKLEQVKDESIADDLSMDLDQLSGDIELDSTEMLDADLDMGQDLEMPDLTSGADLTGDASTAFGEVDEMDTMMDLAKAYIDMGDNDSASSALGEIVKSGNPEQKSEAENLLRKIS